MDSLYFPLSEDIHKTVDNLVTHLLASNSDIVTIRPANPNKRADYQATLNAFEADRGGALWYPYIGSGRGKGALVELLDGSVKYDLISGIGVHWGHHHPKLLRATLAAALHSTVMQGNLQQDMLSVKLIQALTHHSGFDHTFLTTSGAMANENALKLAFHHHPGRSRILAFSRCFMGRTLALASITDKAAYREGLPTTLNVDYLPFYTPETPDAALQAMKTYLHRYPDQHAALCLELIQGEGGYYPAPASFFKALILLAKTHGMSIIADEVQTFGRTSHLFASQHLGLIEDIDILTVGKLLQVCATLFRSTHKPKPGLLSQTFTGASTSLAGGLSILSQLTQDAYLGDTGKIKTLSTQFRAHLEDLGKRYPDVIQGPFGYGSMLAFTPGKGTPNDAKTLCNTLFDHGIIGFIAGDSPARIRFLPPMGGLETEDLEPIFTAIEASIRHYRTTQRL